MTTKPYIINLTRNPKDNHSGWDRPPDQDLQDGIAVVTGSENGFKNAIIFKPLLNIYTVSMYNPRNDKNYNYTYNVAVNSFNGAIMSL